MLTVVELSPDVLGNDFVVILITNEVKQHLCGDNILLIGHVVSVSLWIEVIVILHLTPTTDYLHIL